MEQQSSSDKIYRTSRGWRIYAALVCGGYWAFFLSLLVPAIKKKPWAVLTSFQNLFTTGLMIAIGTFFAGSLWNMYRTRLRLFQGGQFELRSFFRTYSFSTSDFMSFGKFF